MAIGTPFRRLESILGIDKRLLDRAHKQLWDGREKGTIPPFSAGTVPDEMRTNHPLLDRLIGKIMSRREKMRNFRESQVVPLAP